MEVAASVITIAELIWVLLHKSLQYIKDVKLISDPVRELLDRVKDLHRLTRAVASTYRQAEASIGAGYKSLRVVGKALTTCEGRLESLKPLACKLASLESKTWRQKLTVKRRLDKVNGDIQAMEKSICWDMNILNTGLNLLKFDLDANRRPSDTIEERKSIPASGEAQVPFERETPSMTRTLSEADTIFGPDLDLQLRIFPTPATLSPSRPSISSTSSHAPSRLSDRSNSMASSTGLAPVSSKSAWVDFHFHIAKCAGDKERIRNIRDILHQHSEDTDLVKSTDDWNRTPLHVAAQQGDVHLARTLVEFGADINAQDSMSEPSSVLDMAVAGGRRNFVAFLLDLNVDESALLPQNAAKLKEIKRTIRFEKQNALKKSHTASQSSHPNVVI